MYLGYIINSIIYNLNINVLAIEKANILNDRMSALNTPDHENVLYEQYNDILATRLNYHRPTARCDHRACTNWYDRTTYCYWFYQNICTVD